MSTQWKVGGQKKEKLCQLKDPWPYFFCAMFYQAGQTVFLRVRSSTKRKLLQKNVLHQVDVYLVVNLSLHRQTCSESINNAFSII